MERFYDIPAEPAKKHLVTVEELNEAIRKAYDTKVEAMVADEACQHARDNWEKAVMARDAAQAQVQALLRNYSDQVVSGTS